MKKSPVKNRFPLSSTEMFSLILQVKIRFVSMPISLLNPAGTLTARK